MPTTRVGENDLHYQIRGSGPGLPAVLLMGLGTDLHGWDFVAPRLEAGRPLLLIDNRGAGRSAKPPGPYTTDELALDAVAVMEAAGMPRAHIVGVSLGGAIAQKLALQHPARVASLALLATFADLDARMHATAEAGARAASGRDMAASLQAMTDSETAIDPRALFKFLMPLVFTPEFLVRERQMLKEMYQRSLEAGVSIKGFAGQLAAAWSHKTMDELGRLDVPTLVVLPDADRLVPPAQSRAIARAIPGARLHELPGGVHGFIIEAAAETGELLDRWLAENDPV